MSISPVLLYNPSFLESGSKFQFSSVGNKMTNFPSIDLRKLDKSFHTFTDHTNEIMDVTFNLSGTKIATASSDCTSKIYDVETLEMNYSLEGHKGEISKVMFDSRGNNLLTGSADGTCKIWDVKSGKCLQSLEGHHDEIFSCAFNYEGNTIITASKDNTCKIWKAKKD